MRMEIIFTRILIFGSRLLIFGTRLNFYINDDTENFNGNPLWTDVLFVSL